MSEVASRARRKESRQHEVVETAAKVFYKRGYEAATIQDIADALGILKGSLYHYIDSKEELLFAVIEDPHREALELVERCRQVQGTVTERLEFLLRGHVQMLTENHVKWAIFVHEFDALSRPRREQLREARRSFEVFLSQLLEEGRENGEFEQDLDVELTALAVLGMVNWASRWYRPEGPQQPPEIAETFIQLTLHGITART